MAKPQPATQPRDAKHLEPCHSPRICARLTRTYARAGDTLHTAHCTHTHRGGAETPREPSCQCAAHRAGRRSRGRGRVQSWWAALWRAVRATCALWATRRAGARAAASPVRRGLFRAHRHLRAVLPQRFAERAARVAGSRHRGGGMWAAGGARDEDASESARGRGMWRMVACGAWVTAPGHERGGTGENRCWQLSEKARGYESEKRGLSRAADTCLHARVTAHSSDRTDAVNPYAAWIVRTHVLPHRASAGVPTALYAANGRAGPQWHVCV